MRERVWQWCVSVIDLSFLNTNNNNNNLNLNHINIKKWSHTEES